MPEAEKRSNGVLKSDGDGPEEESAPELEKDCTDDWFYEAKEMAHRCTAFFCKE